MALTPKQESFCLKYIETGNASEAYRQCYSAEKMSQEAIRVEASRLLENPNIALRLAAIRAPALKRAEVTLEQHLNDLKRLRDAAERENQLSAAIKAEESRGKVSGLYKEQIEVTGSITITIEDLLKRAATA